MEKNCVFDFLVTLTSSWWKAFLSRSKVFVYFNVSLRLRCHEMHFVYLVWSNGSNGRWTYEPMGNGQEVVAWPCGACVRCHQATGYGQPGARGLRVLF